MTARTMISRTVADLHRPETALEDAARALYFLAQAHVDSEDIGWDLVTSLLHHGYVVNEAAANLAYVRGSLAEGYGVPLTPGITEESVHVPLAQRANGPNLGKWQRSIDSMPEHRDVAFVEACAMEALSHVSADTIHAIDTDIYRAMEALSAVTDPLGQPTASRVSALHALPRVMDPIYSSRTFENLGSCVNMFMKLHAFNPEYHWSDEALKPLKRQPIAVPSWRQEAAGPNRKPPIRKASRTPVVRTTGRTVAGRKDRPMH